MGVELNHKRATKTEDRSIAVFGTQRSQSPLDVVFQRWVDRKETVEFESDLKKQKTKNK